MTSPVNQPIRRREISDRLEVAMDTLSAILPPAPSPFSSDPIPPPSSIYLHVSSPSTPPLSSTASSSLSPSIASFPVTYSDFVSIPPTFASIPSAKVIITSNASSSTTVSSTSTSSTKITISTTPNVTKTESSTNVFLSTPPPFQSTSSSTSPPPPTSTSSQSLHSIHIDEMEPQTLTEDVNVETKRKDGGRTENGGKFENGARSENSGKFENGARSENGGKFENGARSENGGKFERNGLLENGSPIENGWKFESINGGRTENGARFENGRKFENKNGGQTENGARFESASRTENGGKFESNNGRTENGARFETGGRFEVAARTEGDANFENPAKNPPSDCESDEVDLLRVMMKGKREDDKDSLVQDPPSATEEEEEEDEDERFLVHFAHTGRKRASNMASSIELLDQITELQEAVVGMKTTLTEAVTRLGSVSEDTSLTREVTEVRESCQSNTSEVLKLVLSLKADITALQKEVSAVNDRQEGLHATLTQILEDRRLLLADLSQAGVISIHTRSRLEPAGTYTDGTGAAGTGGGIGRSCSGSHSNDSGVALLLERAHQAFTSTHTPSPTPTQHRASDQDSLPDQPSLLVPPSVYDYVAGLRPHHTPHLPQPPQPPHRQGVDAGGGGGSQIPPGDGGRGGVDEEGGDIGLLYDSDSSLTLAANKTLSLSNSLSQQCAHINLRTVHTPTPYHTHTHAHGRQMRTHERTHTRSEPESSDKLRNPLRYHDHGGGSIDSSSDPFAVVMRGREGGEREREAQRYRVAKELFDTEKKYCKTLWIIQDVFAEPLKKAGILSHKDINTLFPEEVYQLYDKHCLLQHQLRERLASWKWQPMVGDVLARFTDAKHTDVLRLYTAYVNEFPEVLKTFHKLCRASQPFTKFIKGCLEQPSCAGLDLGAFLLTPVQRVPRYILLLKQLLKATPPLHPDHQHLHVTLERLRLFLSRLNDSMEHSFQLVHSQLAPLPPPLHPHPPPPSVMSPEGYRPSRLPRRSLSSPASSSPPLSPPTSPARSAVGGEGRASPQRSHSCIAPPPSRHPRAHDNRSSSLPRGSPSSSSGSNEATSPPRVRSRSESVASRRPLPSMTPNAQAGARGSHWGDLTASEPSLADPRPTPAPSALSPGRSEEGGVSGAPQPWPRTSPVSDPPGRKKPSLRTSLKNMFTFKKSRAHRLNHHNHHHHNYHSHHQPPPPPSYSISRSAGRGGSEGEYLRGLEAAGINKQQQQQQQRKQEASTTATGLSVIGDFVDEEGNPCSNV